MYIEYMNLKIMSPNFQNNIISSILYYYNNIIVEKVHIFYDPSNTEYP